MASTGWRLVAPDGSELGLLTPADGDMPWTSCRFAPRPAFGRVAPLFAQELALLNRDEMEAWDAAYGRVAALGLELRPEDGGEPIREFILHIDGDEAWFRY